MSFLVAAFILGFALLPRETTAQEATAGHVLSDDPELARAIRKLRPGAGEWTLRSPDGSLAYRAEPTVYIAEAGKWTLRHPTAVFVDFPPHKTIGRAQLYRSFFCKKRGEDPHWKCKRRSKTIHVLVAPASTSIAGSQECPATVRGIVADGVDTNLIPDLVDFLRSNPIGQEGAMHRICGRGPPTCRVSLIEPLEGDRHKVYLTIDARRWLEVTMDAACHGKECHFEPIDCIEAVT